MNSSYQTDAYKTSCDARVVESRTLPECPSESLEPIGRCGPLVAKIPVVLAEPKIQIDVEAEIKLNEPALEIKRIKKNVFLSQCKLIIFWDSKHDRHDGKDKDEKNDEFRHEEKHKVGKLFISGFVRKNIEYATYNSKYHGTECLRGEIHHTTCDVPFECVTKVHFVTPPVVFNNGFTTETETFATKFNLCDPCSQPIVGNDLCEQGFRNFEFFNEKVFCELVSANIFEEDIHKGAVTVGCTTEHTFDKLTEKNGYFPEA